MGTRLRGALHAGGGPLRSLTVSRGRRLRAARAGGPASWLVCGLAVGACVGEAAPPAAGERQVVDAEGRRVALAAPARRIVSLVPSVTATLVELGATERLVGRTAYDTAQALAHLPSVGGGLGPDLEALAALAPDLVIRFGGDSDRRTPARLDDLAIPHLAVRPDGVADVWTVLDQLGTLLGLESRADDLAASLRGELDAVRAAVAGLPEVRAVYLMGGSPPWTAGAGTYLHELVELAGGTNVFADMEGLYGAVSPEVVATRPVDVVLLADGAQVDPRLLEGRRVERLSAAVQIPGPDLAAAAREVARALHPGLDFVR